MTNPTSKQPKDCICLQDNKMTQALCPVHNPKDQSTSWEERFEDEFTIFYEGEALMDGTTPEKLKSFIRKLLASSQRELLEKILKVDIGAIPESDPYAKGWNDARQTYWQELKSQLSGEEKTCICKVEQNGIETIVSGTLKCPVHRPK